VIVAYRAASCAGVVLSKMDEAVKLGPALDALIRHRLKVIGVANGQRVPEDWHRLSANALIQRALRGGGSSAYRLDASDVNLIFTASRHADAAAARCTPDVLEPIVDAMSRPSSLRQAHGLRRLFAHAQTHFVPVVSNPHVGLRRPDARTPVRRFRRARRPHAGRRRFRAGRAAGREALFELAPASNRCRSGSRTSPRAACRPAMSMRPARPRRSCAPSSRRHRPARSC
jgi:hypothetical protein